MKFNLILICLLLTACSSLSPIYEDAQVADITYDQVHEDLDGYKNSLVRWSGVIVDEKNHENFSLLQVIYYPSDYYGRPQLDEANDGRFIIKSVEILDSEIYAPDREITVLGVIDGDIEQTIDNTSQLPLINSTAIHLWPINYRNDYFSHCPSCYFRQLFW